MKQHKWHKEIKAWADGAEIQIYYEDTGEWMDTIKDRVGFNWYENLKYRIKPQPKEPQCQCGKYKEIIPNQTTIDAINEARKNREEEEYVYLYLTEKGDYVIEEAAQADIDTNGKWEYIGKIKLEENDE